ncbi:MAG: Ig-like domain-containing protein, partial [Actinomycetota bacterium]
QFEALAAGQTATDSFTYTMTDGRGGFATATVNVTINGADELPNMPPVAVDDVLVVDEDAGPTVVAVLDNDSDPDTGDVLTVTSVGAAATGTSGLSGGVVTYDPAGQFEALAAGQSATDSFTYTIDDGNGETATATVNVTINGADEGVESFYVSSNTSGTVAGISFTDEDILRYDSVTDTWSMFFDGSDVLPDVDVDAIHINDDGSIDMSFLADATVDGLGLVTDSDVVTFTGTTGPNTSGTFSLALTGSAVGLNSAAEDIKALSKVGTDYAISTIGTALVPGAGGNLSGADDDLIVLDGTNSVWSTLFDGSDVGLTVSAEDLRGASILANGNIYLNTLGNHDVGGVTGDDNDVLRFTGTTGPTTAGTFVKAWDGDAHGWTVNISALHVEP